MKTQSAGFMFSKYVFLIYLVIFDIIAYGQEAMKRSDYTPKTLVPFLAFQGLPQISFSLDQKCLEKSSFRQLPAHEKNWIHSEIKRWFPSCLNFRVLHEIMKDPRGAAGNDN